MTDGTKQIETEVAERIITEEIACATGPTGGWLDSPKAIAAAILLRLKMRSKDAPAQVPTDPSKRYWITEQGMKEATTQIFAFLKNNASASGETWKQDFVSGIIAAHSEAASPPTEWTWRAMHLAREVELRRARMEKAGPTMQDSTLGDEIKFLEGEILNFVRNAALATARLAAAPPQGTPAPDKCPECGSPTKEPRGFVEIYATGGAKCAGICVHPWHSTVAAQKGK